MVLGNNKVDTLTERLVRIAKAHKETCEPGPYLDWVNRILQEVYGSTWKPPGIADTLDMGQRVKAGMLRDVSEAARLVGFEVLYITSDVWGTINNIPPQSTKTVRERLLETVVYARRAALFGEENFKVPMLYGRRHFAQFKLVENTIELRGAFSLIGGKPLPD